VLNIATKAMLAAIFKKPLIILFSGFMQNLPALIAYAMLDLTKFGQFTITHSTHPPPTQSIDKIPKKKIKFFVQNIVHLPIFCLLPHPPSPAGQGSDLSLFSINQKKIVSRIIT